MKNNTSLFIAQFICTALIIIISGCGPDHLASLSAQDLNESKERAKAYVREMNAEISTLLSDARIDRAKALLDRGIEGCSQLQDVQTCRAGMYFVGGYMYQQAAKSGGSQARAYQREAESYYERVLEIFPDNKDAWSNLIKLKEARGVNESTIEMMENLAQRYPEARVGYLVRIGDLYTADGNPHQACEYYKRAYEEDPFSERVCRAMVGLYAQKGFECILGQSLTTFAYDCMEIGLPNYSEELLRHQIEQNQDGPAINEMLVTWADILAENRWLDPQRVDDLRRRLFTGRGRAPASNTEANTILLDLRNLFSADDPAEVEDAGFWNEYYPRIYISDNRGDLSPMAVYLKILHVKGDQALFRKDPGRAEAFWRNALIRAENYHNPMFTYVAKDLAQLYDTYPELDRENRKLNRLVRELFNMKGEAYASLDMKMIREYHITLAGIFYDMEVWNGRGAANAQFQLENALSSRFGPIVNPDLRKMLGDVYMRTGEAEKATETYSKAAQDMLSLDRINEGNRLLDRTRNLAVEAGQRDLIAELDDLSNIVQLRHDCADPEHPIHKKNPNVYAYFTQLAVSEKENLATLDQSFVRLQYFKALSDLAENVPEERKNHRQIIYAEALQKISNVENLASASDYKRLQNIKKTLEESVEQPRQMKTMQMTKQAHVSYDYRIQNREIKTYSIPAIDQKVTIPLDLFELQNVIQSYYKTDDAATEVPMIEYDRAEFKIKKGEK